jgi:AcrR family transcriptional regulator
LSNSTEQRAQDGLAAAKVVTLQTRKQQFVRDEIWDTAVRLFAEKGFDETTVDDIARESGVSRRSFFRYFSSKSDLLAQGIVTYGLALTEAINRCPRTDSLLEVVRHTVQDVAHFAASNPRTRTLIEIATKYPEAREAQLSRMGEVQEQITEVFAGRCGTDPKDADLASKLLARLTLSMIDTALLHWFQNGGEDILPIVDQVFATLFEVFCPMTA